MDLMTCVKKQNNTDLNRAYNRKTINTLLPFICFQLSLKNSESQIFIYLSYGIVNASQAS